MNSISIKNKNIFPSKVVCIGRNYSEHIKELNNPNPEEMVFFIKPNSSVSNEIVFPKKHKSCHYEAELSFLIEEGNISAVGFGLDLTLREVQTKLKNSKLPWERAKAFDKSAVFSEFVDIKHNDIASLKLQLFINNELRQEGGVVDMINKPEEIIEEANTFLSFEDGDILMTGTPKGVGEFNIGDKFSGKIFLEDKEILSCEFNVK